MNKESKQLFRSTSVVGLMTFLSRVMGLIRDIFFARLFGAFPIMDAFFVALKYLIHLGAFLLRAHFLEHLFPFLLIMKKIEQN